MFYVKTNISNNAEIKVELYEDEIYTHCYECGKEIQVDTDILINIWTTDGDLSSTSIKCKECSKKDFNNK